MISLKEYINNYANDELENHFKLEFGLYESFKYRLLNLSESGGAFDGQIQLSEILTKEIFKNIKKSSALFMPIYYKYDDKTNVPEFFRTIVIQLSQSKDTAFLGNKSDYDKNDKIYKTIFITVNVNDIKDDEGNESYKLCFKNIAHEILHAWNEYSSLIKNSLITISSLSAKDSPYLRAIQNKDFDIDNPKTFAHKLFYYLSKFEQNAYFSEFKLEFDKIDKSKIKSFKDAYEHFKQTDSFIIYTSLINQYKLMRNGKKDKSFVEKFVDAWNDLEDKFETENKIFKRLDDIIEKNQKKMNKIIPSIYIEYMENEDKLASKIKEGINDSGRRLMLDSIKIKNL